MKRLNSHKERISLDAVEPNPWRDLKVDPWGPRDEQMVEAWRRIFARHGFLKGPIIGRRVGDNIEVIAGEAWVEALRRLGRDNIPIELVNADDVDAVRLGFHLDVYLNGGGHSPTGIAGTVAMALRVLLSDAGRPFFADPESHGRACDDLRSGLFRHDVDRRTTRPRERKVIAAVLELVNHPALTGDSVREAFETLADSTVLYRILDDAQ